MMPPTPSTGLWAVTYLGRRGRLVCEVFATRRQAVERSRHLTGAQDAEVWHNFAGRWITVREEEQRRHRRAAQLRRERRVVIADVDDGARNVVAHVSERHGQRIDVTRVSGAWSCSCGADVCHHVGAVVSTLQRRGVLSASRRRMGATS